VTIITILSRKGIFPAKYYIEFSQRNYERCCHHAADNNQVIVEIKEEEMIIKRYSDADESPLFEMLIEEGDDWSDYHGEKGRDKYTKALKSSLTYVIYDDNILCGFVRCREDDGFGVYVYDLLVRKSYRGRQLGKKLMEQVCKDFANQPVYVMSDVDPYYEKLGYRKLVG
jgi:ribosomal protein S18 acetylase RimI-like enzyme